MYCNASNAVGIFVRSQKKSPEVIEMPNVLPFDEGLQEEWQQRLKDHNRREDEVFTNAQQRKTTEWWKQYNVYLKTTAWRLKRQAVMTRANNWCEGCRGRQATQVHHLTYKHVFNEFLFELVAVCDDCHSRIHSEE